MAETSGATRGARRGLLLSSRFQHIHVSKSEVSNNNGCLRWAVEHGRKSVGAGGVPELKKTRARCQMSEHATYLSEARESMQSGMDGRELPCVDGGTVDGE